MIWFGFSMLERLEDDNVGLLQGNYINEDDFFI